MSAIWGYIDFLGKTNKDSVEKINTTMKKGYESCVIDRFGEYVSDGLCMGCGIQYFTPEAQNEVLPIIDEERGIFFTADAIIDNRSELLEKLGINKDDGTIPDGKIIFDYFDKFGQDGLNDMLGVYTFVYYNRKEETCYIVNDITGRRALQYHYDDGKLYFSTLALPICDALGRKKANERWFADFLSLDNAALCLDYDSTPYEGIDRLRAASCYRFNKDKVSSGRYWKITPTVIKLKTDEEYKKLFIKTYMDAIERVIRNDNLAMLLSGGLDSTSVLCMLAESNKAKKIKLKTYTSVPRKDYKLKEGAWGKADETQEVIQTKEYLHKKGFDFETEFISLDDVNIWDERNKIMDILEMPYKNIQNLLWIKKSLEEAYKQGARISLIGAYGNCTVSAGDADTFLYELLKEHKYITFLIECNALGRIFHTPRKRHLKNIMSIIHGYNAKTTPKVNIDNVLLSDTAKKKYDIMARLQERYIHNIESSRSLNASKVNLLNEAVFYNYSENQTRQSLATGVIFRDPTADKRIIELCASLPVSCFVKNGIHRRLIREYLREYLPEHVQNQSFRGEQSADMTRRVSEDRDGIYGALKGIFERHRYSELVDIDKALVDIGTAISAGQRVNSFKVKRLMYTAMALEMIDKINCQ